MIQRIQTLFLLLASALMLCLLFVTIGQFNGANTTYLFQSEGLYLPTPEQVLVYPTWPLLILIIATSVLPLVTIFLYKRRPLQARFCVFNIILMIAVYLLIGWYWWQFTSNLEVLFMPSATLVMPFVAIFLTHLSFRRIWRDEFLVRTADRIR